MDFRAIRVPRPTIVAAVLLAVFGVACSDGREAVEVLPAEEIFASDITIEPDPTGTSATLLLTTELDMACAVVYGTTEELGDGLATDTDMGGGAHSDHSAVMLGLQPDTEYFYRVQGSGVDGRLYQSELMTFRTPAAAQVSTPGENVAVGADVVSVSSEFSDDFAAGNAVDGDLATAWSTAGDGDDASITIDLGRSVNVVGVGLRSRSMTDGTAIIESFTVTVDDGGTLGPFSSGEGLAVAEASFTGQVLRFDAVETTGGNTGAVEIEVYE